MIDIYAEVIINSEASSIDKPFTYLVPEQLQDKIRVGYRVKVPFGPRSLEGFIIGLKCDLEKPIKGIKKITKILDDFPLLDREDLLLIDYMKKRYLCKYIDAIRTIVPSGLTKGYSVKIKKTIICVCELSSKYINNQKYVELYDYVKNNNGMYSKTEITKNNQYSLYALNKLIQEKILAVSNKTIYRYNTKKYTDNKNILNDEQKMAVDTVINSSEKGFLLKGVTGSGKTEVYMNIAEKMISEDKSVIMLVPEISLTPQMIERFKGRFGQDVSLFHSRLSQGERIDEWFRIKQGKARLVVGARSALFLPMKNLGLIIIDEEHENTYKSEQNPKYDSRDIARAISIIKNCKFILGSATPSIETFYYANKNKLKLIELKNRVMGKSLPDYQIVDMRDELKAGHMSLLSRKMISSMQEALNNNKQIILFLNRRGFSTFVSCRSCGYVFKCQDCDIALTYHKNGYLVCHYCGKTIKQPKICPKCHSKYVKFFGAGTERVEAEVKKYFKNARVLRMDVDTTRYKDSHEKIYNAFKNHEADILIGTQMVSKGLDFKNVTLVGILAADMSLNIPDYRSEERTYQIITQVSGRAGRGDDNGMVIVQTYSPSSKVIEYALHNNYEAMYTEQINLRKLMDYPPFSKILLINVTSQNEKLLISFMENVKKKILLLDDINNYQCLGPSPCIISKIKERYRWQYIVKGDFNIEFAKKVKDILYELSKSVYNEIRLSMDINPNNMI